MVAVEDYTVRTPDGVALFSIDKLHLFQGDRLVLLGRNGAGKSQFIQGLRRALMLPDGEAGIRVSPTIRLGYSDQEMSQLAVARARRSTTSPASARATSGPRRCSPRPGSPSNGRTAHRVAQFRAAGAARLAGAQAQRAQFLPPWTSPPTTSTLPGRSASRRKSCCMRQLACWFRMTAGSSGRWERAISRSAASGCAQVDGPEAFFAQAAETG